MALVKSGQQYLTIMRDYRLAEEWQKPLILRGPMALACQNLEPESMRTRLRPFWLSEMTRLKLDVEKWKSWA